MPYPVENLIEGRGKPISVLPDRSVKDALSLMIEYDFSQLPVVDDQNHPKGMITYGSIVRALSNFGLKVDQLQVANAVIKAPKHHFEDDLFDLLDRLKDTNAVLIVNGNDQLVGIVTTFDSTEYFRRRAEDMMLVEDIENMVKDLVLVPFTNHDGQIDSAALKQAIADISDSRSDLEKRFKKALGQYLCGVDPANRALRPDLLAKSLKILLQEQEPRDFDDLTLYDYVELLLSKDRWDNYQGVFGLEPGAIRNFLDDVRDTRNALAHFRPDISAEQRDQLRFCASWLAGYPVDLFAAHANGIPVDWITGVDAAGSLVRESPVSYTTDQQIIPFDEEFGPRESRYAPLALKLQRLPGSQDRVKLRFEEVEAIIRGDLPASARAHRTWWANDSVGHVQSRQWLDAGWRVGSINMTAGHVTFVRIREREQAYIHFFSQLQEHLRTVANFPMRELSPDGASWQTLATLPTDGPRAMSLVASFARGGRLRVELYIDTGSQERNKAIFDFVAADRSAIEQEFGHDISWERLNSRRASRIAVYHTGGINDDANVLDALLDWGTDIVPRFYAALAPRAELANSKSSGDGS